MKRVIIMTKIIPTYIAALLLTAIHVVAETAEFEYTVSTDPAATSLAVVGINSQVEVIGTETNTIKVRVEGLKPMPEIPEGMRSLLRSGDDNTGLGLELKPSDEDGNQLVLKQVHRKVGEKVIVEVPKALSLDIKTHMNQGVDITGISGEVSAESLNGSIRLEAVSGPLTLSTVNGGIVVGVTQLVQTRPSSITTVNGRVELILSESEKATFDLSVLHGDIYTDLDIVKEEKSHGNDHHHWDHLAGNRDIHATLNGGGASVTLSAVNGEIYLRKAK